MATRFRSHRHLRLWMKTMIRTNASGMATSSHEKETASEKRPATDEMSRKTPREFKRSTELEGQTEGQFPASQAEDAGSGAISSGRHRSSFIFCSCRIGL